MKRIIDGVTYDTKTSQQIARAEAVENAYGGRPEERFDYTLYRTRGGAFFVHTITETSRRTVTGDWKDVEQHAFEPLTRAQAQDWILQGDVEVLDDKALETPPEAAETTKPEATIYIRVPSSLKDQAEAKARAEDLSLNSWMMRCTESCVGAQGDKLPEASGNQPFPGTTGFDLVLRKDPSDAWMVKRSDVDPQGKPLICQGEPVVGRSLDAKTKQLVLAALNEGFREGHYRNVVGISYHGTDLIMLNQSNGFALA